MRDGWLEEPLRSLLRNSAFRRWREGRMESRILRHAKGIQVTSDIWKKLLSEGFPTLLSKIHVLTNGYPLHTPPPQLMPPKGPGDRFQLIHAGRFIDSDKRRTPNLLLEPLLNNLASGSHSGTIELLGPLSKDEQAIIEPFKSRFTEIGWHIECPGRMPRCEVLKLLPKADGLLLLSASHAALPSKLFEYIPTGRPLFVVTTKDSAVWNICGSLPQATLINMGDENFHPRLDNQIPYYAKAEHRIPPDFCEQSLAQTFKDIINL
jgi:hypothetical protein